MYSTKAFEILRKWVVRIADKVGAEDKETWAHGNKMKDSKKVLSEMHTPIIALHTRNPDTDVNDNEGEEDRSNVND